MTKAFAWKLQRTSGSSVSTRRGGILCNMIFSLWNLFRCVKSYVPQIHGLVPKKSHFAEQKELLFRVGLYFQQLLTTSLFFLSHLLSSFFVERSWTCHFAKVQTAVCISVSGFTKVGPLKVLPGGPEEGAACRRPCVLKINGCEMYSLLT